MIKEEERLEKKQSLQTKFVSLVVFIAVGPLFLVGIFALGSFFNQGKEAIANNEVTRTELTAREISNEYSHLQSLASQLAYDLDLLVLNDRVNIDSSIPGLPEDQKVGKRTILQNIIKSYTAIEAVYLLNKEGDVYLAEPYQARQSLNISNLASRDWFTCARLEKNVCRGQLFLEGTGFTPYQIISAPLIKDEEIKGIIALKINLTYLGDLLSAIDDRQEGKMYAVNDLGVVLASSDFDDVRSQVSLSGQAPFKEISKGNSGFLEVDTKQGAVFLAFSPIKKDGEVIGGVLVEQSKSVIFASASRLRNMLLSVLVVACLLIIVFITLATRTVAKPIEDLTRVATQISLGDLDQNVEISSRDEIGVLAFNFNKMVFRLKEFYAKLENAVAERTEALNHKVKDLEEARKKIKKSRDEIEENKKWFEIILSSIGEGVYVLDKNEKIILFNDAAARLLGWGKEEVLGKSELDIMRPQDERGHKITRSHYQVVQTWLKGETQTFKDMFFQKKNKKVLPVALAVAPIKNNQGKVMAGVIAFRDITIEREIDRMKSEFVSVASHQLRTPLSSIKWFLEMILSGRAGKINDKQNEFIKEAYMSNQRMIELVNSLLNVSRIETGRVAVNPAPCDLVTLTQSVITEITPEIKIKKQQFQFITPPKKLPLVNIDERVIRQVLQNLINNACKYTPNRGKIEVEILEKGEDIIFRVEDTGYGIPGDQQDKIFQKFFRADNVVLKATEGSGLGLYIAKSAVELSGGRIWFESVEDEGTTFYFTIPKKGSKAVKGEKSLSVIN